MNSLYFKVTPSKAGLPLVFLHGFLGNHQDWQPVFDKLAQQHTCIALDLPGHGASSHIKAPLDNGFAATSRLIGQTLTELGVNAYILIGYSLGGRIALYHARRQPQGIKALVLESSHTGLSSEPEKQQRLLADQNWAKRWSSQAITETLALWYQQGVFDSLTPIQKQSLVNKRKVNQGEALAHMLLATSLGKQDNLAPFLGHTELPVYYFCSRQDRKFFQLASHLSKAHPNLQIRPFSEAGHNIHLEQAIPYAQELAQITSSLSESK